MSSLDILCPHKKNVFPAQVSRACSACSRANCRTASFKSFKRRNRHCPVVGLIGRIGEQGGAERSHGSIFSFAYSTKPDVIRGTFIGSTCCKNQSTSIFKSLHFWKLNSIFFTYSQTQGLRVLLEPRGYPFGQKVRVHAKTPGSLAFKASLGFLHLAAPEKTTLSKYVLSPFLHVEICIQSLFLDVKLT